MSITRLIPAGTAALLLLSIAPLAGCGADRADGATTASSADAEGDSGDGDTDEEKGAEHAGTPQTVDCPDQATAVDLPADFSAPLPAGAVVVAVDERDDGRTVVTAVVPAAEPDVLADLQAAYPAAGLTLTEGETEERDAESNFTGDVTGRWGIRELPDCSEPATRIDLVVRAS
jgi:hypothetical protein